MLQTHFDRIDPGFFVRFLNQALPGREKSDRKVMIQMAVADTSVPNFATLFQARGAGTPFSRATSIHLMVLKPSLKSALPTQPS